jgi:hypothetical protein
MLKVSIHGLGFFAFVTAFFGTAHAKPAQAARTPGLAKVVETPAPVTELYVPQGILDDAWLRYYVPFTETVSLGLLERGDYDVMVNEEISQTLSVGLSPDATALAPLYPKVETLLRQGPPKRFDARFDVPASLKGRRLLHVRTQNGSSLNQVVDFECNGARLKGAGDKISNKIFCLGHGF